MQIGLHRVYDAIMSSENQQQIEAAKGILCTLNAETIKAELRRMDAETQALRVLLRAARAKERAANNAEGAGKR
jgi:hypothetical protein